MRCALSFTAAVILIAAWPGQAQEPTASSFSGFVDLGFNWNDNEPGNRENFIPGTGTTAKRANEFSLNLAQIQWTRATSSEQPVGFTLALVAGEGTEVVHAGEPKGGDEFRHVYQASIAFRLKSGVVVEAGVYPSHIGMGGFYSKDNWNYTRSWLGEFSPYYQTGIKASYPFNERWSAQLHLCNGWQLINDNNEGKAIGGQIAYSNGPLTASLNTFTGPELAGDSDSLRNFVDLVVLYRVSDRLQIGGSVDAGSQEYPDRDAASWRGVGGYARYAPSTRNAFALRAERFDDPDNGITGIAQTLREVTFSWELRPRQHVTVKLETRYDRSDADVFAGAGESRTDRQFLALSAVVVTF